jgi:6-phosphogluconolactonase
MSRTFLYASIGSELAWFDVHLGDGVLTRRGSVQAPANVQYAWVHPSKPYMYVASTDMTIAYSAGKYWVAAPGSIHLASAFRIDPGSGALTPLGRPRELPSRPIHCSVDVTGTYLLTAYNSPSSVTVHRIEPDGSLGELVEQRGQLEAGIYAHQVRVTPSNRSVLVVARGNDATDSKPEDPGAIKVLDFDNGIIANRATIAPGDGLGFGPRHLDFHPQRPWVFVAIERQDQLHVYELQDHSLSPAPMFVRTTLAAPDNVRPRQMVGAVRVHPNGRFVYVANRNSGLVDVEGTAVANGGENSLAVFAIDQATGEPRLVQHADPHTIHVRTFSVDPTGRLLVAASIFPMPVRSGGAVTTLPAGLSVFHIGADGTLAFVRKYDVDAGQAPLWWSGMATFA